MWGADTEARPRQGRQSQVRTWSGRWWWPIRRRSPQQGVRRTALELARMKAYREAPYIPPERSTPGGASSARRPTVSPEVARPVSWRGAPGAGTCPRRTSGQQHSSPAPHQALSRNKIRSLPAQSPRDPSQRSTSVHGGRVSIHIFPPWLPQHCPHRTPRNSACRQFNSCVLLWPRRQPDPATRPPPPIRPPHTASQHRQQRSRAPSPARPADSADASVTTAPQTGKRSRPFDCCPWTESHITGKYPTVPSPWVARPPHGARPPHSARGPPMALWSPSSAEPRCVAHHKGQAQRVAHQQEKRNLPCGAARGWCTWQSHSLAHTVAQGHAHFLHVSNS